MFVLQRVGRSFNTLHVYPRIPQPLAQHHQRRHEPCSAGKRPSPSLGAKVVDPDVMIVRPTGNARKGSAHAVNVPSVPGIHVLLPGHPEGMHPDSGVVRARDQSVAAHLRTFTDGFVIRAIAGRIEPRIATFCMLYSVRIGVANAYSQRFMHGLRIYRALFELRAALHSN